MQGKEVSSHENIDSRPKKNSDKSKNVPEQSDNNNETRNPTATPLEGVFTYSQEKKYYFCVIKSKKSLHNTVRLIQHIIDRVWSDEEVERYRQKSDDLIKIKNKWVILEKDIYEQLNSDLKAFNEPLICELNFYTKKFIFLSGKYICLPSAYANISTLVKRMNGHLQNKRDSFRIEKARGVQRTSSGIAKIFSNLPIITISEAGFERWCEFLDRPSSELTYSSTQDTGFDKIEIICRLRGGVKKQFWSKIDIKKTSTPISNPDNLMSIETSVDNHTSCHSLIPSQPSLDKESLTTPPKQLDHLEKYTDGTFGNNHKFYTNSDAHIVKLFFTNIAKMAADGKLNNHFVDLAEVLIETKKTYIRERKSIEELITSKSSILLFDSRKHRSNNEQGSCNSSESNVSTSKL